MTGTVGEGAPANPELNAAIAAKQRHRIELLLTRGVLRVSIAYRILSVGGPNQPCILIETMGDPAKVGRLPSELDGVPCHIERLSSGSGTHVRYGGLPYEHRLRYRPVPAGVSVGHYRLRSSGTLGLWIRDAKTNEPLLMSCWHVIANCGDCAEGDPILQPGAGDGGECPEDIIAYLLRWIDVTMLTPGQSVEDARNELQRLVRCGAALPLNTLDVAVARPASPDLVDPRILGLGRVTSVGGIKPGEGGVVRKSGTATGTTRGTIAQWDVDLFIHYPVGVALFVEQVGFAGIGQPFSRPGDSGSVAVCARRILDPSEGENP